MSFSKARAQDIMEDVDNEARFAERILEGEEGYDGADGARTVSHLCALAKELHQMILEVQT